MYGELLTTINVHIIPLKYTNHMENQELLQHQAIEIMEMIDDVVEYYCDENIISGEKVWVMINALSTIKVNQFPHNEDD